MAKTPKPPNYPGVTRQLRRMAPSEVPDALLTVPPGAENATITCGCGRAYPPPWAKKLEHEYAPITSADGAHFVLSGVPIPCPRCRTENLFSLPESTEQNGTVRLFGDESSEWVAGGYLYVYAFVGLHSERLAHMQASLNEAKLAIRPESDPAAWIWHTWEVRGTRWRAAHGVTLEIAQIDEVITKLLCDLAKMPEDGLIAATVFPSFMRLKIDVTQRKTEILVRDRTLTGSVVGMTDFLTDRGFTPEFTVEAQTVAHENNEIDAFVERVGRGLRHNLGYHYVCRRKMVGLPTTAPKGACTELELADLVAFVVRRYFRSIELRLTVEFPLEQMGQVLWGTFAGTRFGTWFATGFPWDHFYPGMPIGNG